MASKKKKADAPPGPITINPADRISKKEASAAGKALAQRKEDKPYYIVNPAGAVHSVTKDRARELLKQPGYRLATQAEVDELRKRHGHQTWDDPIAPPFAPVVPAEPEVE